MDNYKVDIFEAFKKRCYDLINSKFILSSNKIKAILEWTVVNPSLYDFIRQCTNNIDFRYELSKCISSDEKGNKTFQLPQSNRYIITIVLGMLYDLDSENITLNALLSDLFYPATLEEAYTRFGQQIIVPFVEAVNNLYVNDLEVAEVEDSTDTDKAISHNSIDFEMLLSTLELDLKDFNTSIKGDNSLTKEEIYTYTMLVEALYHSIVVGDLLMIRATFVGIKNTIKSKKYRSRIKLIEELFKKTYII